MIGGDGHYGKVDQLRGSFHIATRFLHVCFFPFVPRESWIVFRDEQNEWRQTPTAFNLKSIRWAYIRAVLWLLAIFCTVLIGRAVSMGILDQPMLLVPLVGSFVVLLTTIWLLRKSYRWTTADDKRIAELWAEITAALYSAQNHDLQCSSCGENLPYGRTVCPMCGKTHVNSDLWLTQSQIDNEESVIVAHPQTATRLRVKLTSMMKAGMRIRLRGASDDGTEDLILRLIVIQNVYAHG